MLNLHPSTPRSNPKKVYVGNLTVPLSPHEEDVHDTPFIDLMVMMTIHNSVEDVSEPKKGIGISAPENGIIGNCSREA
jgi:hypothetical protein